MENLTVGQIIRHMRSKRSMSARTLSAAAGLSPSYVSKVENQQIEPSFRAFCKIAAVLRLTDAEVLFLVRSSS